MSMTSACSGVVEHLVRSTKPLGKSPVNFAFSLRLWSKWTLACFHGLSTSQFFHECRRCLMRAACGILDQEQQKGRDDYHARKRVPRLERVRQSNGCRVFLKEQRSFLMNVPLKNWVESGRHIVVLTGCGVDME
jgi:hypothetical protein